MNPFTVYVSLFGLNVHLVSLIIVGSFFISGIIAKKHLSINAIIGSAIMTLLGHIIYEDVIIIMMLGIGETRLEWFLYTLLTIGIFSAVFILDEMYSFLHWRIMTLHLFLIFILTISYMLMDGWFYALHLWLIGLGPDPHDIWWFISKALVFWMWLPLLVEDKK